MIIITENKTIIGIIVIVGMAIMAILFSSKPSGPDTTGTITGKPTPSIQPSVSPSPQPSPEATAGAATPSLDSSGSPFGNPHAVLAITLNAGTKNERVEELYGIICKPLLITECPEGHPNRCQNGFDECYRYSDAILAEEEMAWYSEQYERYCSIEDCFTCYLD